MPQGLHHADFLAASVSRCASHTVAKLPRPSSRVTQYLAAVVSMQSGMQCAAGFPSPASKHGRPPPILQTHGLSHVSCKHSLVRVCRLAPSWTRELPRIWTARCLCHGHALVLHNNADAFAVPLGPLRRHLPWIAMPLPLALDCHVMSHIYFLDII